MRILDENGLEISSPDLDLGYLVEEQLLLEHHPKVEAVREKGHYETVAEYPNGGKDIEWVVDVPGVAATDAWDEYEAILRYVLFTEDELVRKQAPTLESRVDVLETTTDDMILLMADLIGSE